MNEDHDENINDRPISPTDNIEIEDDQMESGELSDEFNEVETFNENDALNENEAFNDDEAYMSLTGSDNSLEMEILDESDIEAEPPEEVAEDENFEEFNIDRNLAGMHNYLNKEMEQLPGRTVMEAETIEELFLFWWPHVILVPGQKLPLQVPHGPADMFIKAKESSRIVGFIASPIDRSNLDECIGTTAELLSITSEDSGVTVMVIGRQRFRTLSVVRRTDNNLRGKVLILPELSECPGTLRYPLQTSVPLSWRCHGPSSQRYRIDGDTPHYESLPANVQPPPSSDELYLDSPSGRSGGGSSGSFFSRLFGSRRLSRGSGGSACQGGKLLPPTKDHSQQKQEPLEQMRGDPAALLSSGQSTWVTPLQMREADLITTPAVDSRGQPFSFCRSSYSIAAPSRIPARRDVHAATAHAFGMFPSWVYEMYDTERLIGSVVKELKQWNSTWQLDQWTEEISVQFSYWLLQNLPVPDRQKIQLLEIDHVVGRLQECLRLLRRCSNFLCHSCQQPITTKHRIICLATEGSLQTFVNPHGHLHEMLTVSVVSNVHLTGHATEEYSWFPGYAWTIMQCRTCSSHLGWKFSARRSNLRPNVFYGVCRSSVVPSFTEDDISNGVVSDVANNRSSRWRAEMV